MPASAADLLVKAPISKIPVDRSSYDWSGFYVGANGGYGAGSGSETTAETLGGVVRAVQGNSERSSGFLLGGQLGYNYQFASKVVLGVEADLDWSGISSTRVIHDNRMGVIETYDASEQARIIGTVRGRLGYAFGRVLPYLTGGLAYSNMHFGFSDVFAPGGMTSASASATRTGWVAGIGIEQSLNDAVSVKAEYLHFEIGGFDTIVYGSNGSASPTSLGRSSADVIRAGANYHFGRSAAPITYATFTPSWTGWYAGLNGGAGGGKVSGTAATYDSGGVVRDQENDSARSGGLLFGVQVGYDFALANKVVLGAEADLQWTDIQSHSTFWRTPLIASPGNIGQSQSSSLTLDYFGTLRARLGYSLGQAKPYVTGGLAYGEASFAASLVQSRGYQSSGARSVTGVGWTLGAGVDYALSSTIALRTEYLHVDLEGFDVAVRGNNGNFSPGSINRLGVDVVRAGINWRPGS